jgi:CRISPR-associated protein Cst1
MIMMLRYTGHPIADVGVATICAFCDKINPEALTRDDLRKVSQFMEREYFSGKLLSYLSCVFPNSAYVNPTVGKGKKEDYKREILQGFDNEPHAEAAAFTCVFSGEPAARIVNRQHVPLITGENVLNFFPAGLDGMPISAAFLLAIQAFPLGARRCVGRALAVHCPDDQTLTYEFARRFLGDNRKLLLLAQKSGEKYEDGKAPRTMVIDGLAEIMRSRSSSHAVPAAGTSPSITVYHLTNSGQGPDIDVFNLPSEVVSFVAKALRAGTADIWNKMVARAWEILARPREGNSKSASKAGQLKTAPQLAQAGRNRNFLYEDLFRLPDDAARFIRTYFLRRAWHFARQQKNDPRAEYSAAQEIGLVSWTLTHLFLQEVLGMDNARIDAIREFADRVASHISAENDRRLFRNLCMSDNYFGFRNRLLRASAERVGKGKAPLTSFDEFVLVFEAPDERQRVDRRLAIDLVLIRLIEKLHGEGWFTKEPDAVKDLQEATVERSEVTSADTSTQSA